MKKPLFAFLLVSYCVCIISLAHDLVLPDIYEWGPPTYSGPRDDLEVGRDGFWLYRTESTFGILAKYSDVIAIGTVVTQDIAKLVVNVETPLAGCTKGQPVTIKLGTYDDPELELQSYLKYGLSPDLSAYLPTNQARIVFCVSSNEFETTGYIHWPADKTVHDFQLMHPPAYRLHEGKRSWWYTDRDNGLVLEQFTNIVQAVRFDRNWTNYFHLTRDGMNKNSIRIKEDSFYDMESLIRYATTNHAYLIYNDPLVLPEHKALFPLWHPYVIK